MTEKKLATSHLFGDEDEQDLLMDLRCLRRKLEREDKHLSIALDSLASLFGLSNVNEITR